MALYYFQDLQTAQNSLSSIAINTGQIADLIDVMESLLSAYTEQNDLLSEMRDYLGSIDSKL